MATIRNDVFKIGDNFVTLIGDEVKVGDAAPEFTSVIAGWAKVNPLQGSKAKSSSFRQFLRWIRMFAIVKPVVSMKKLPS
ncbi:hypothetical protein [Candidatus Villigracilis vicinus]|uniref:hypothetical protein n=1 Tax=Candidatus Villigracilis vicinus TaxID=3140679 RepID=UPI0031EE6EEE